MITTFYNLSKSLLAWGQKKQADSRFDALLSFLFLYLSFLLNVERNTAAKVL